jgi:hypothetical protein
VRSYTRIISSLFFLGSSVIAQQAPTPTPTPSLLDLDSLLKAHSHQLRNADGGINDAGFAFLLREIGDAQIVAIAEEHNVEEIPDFATRLFTKLHDSLGFDYFADEQDAYTLRLLSAPARRGNTDSVIALACRWPTALTFATDEEMRMLADIARTSHARGNPLWGLDQAFGATHFLVRLRELAPDNAARSAVDTLARHAESFERVRFFDSGSKHYMSQVATEAEFAHLDSVFHPRPGSEAAWLINALIRSAHIYTAYYLAVDKGLPTAWENAWSRERYLKERFTEEYRLAVSRGDTLPRVLIKAGHWHIHRGLYPGSMAPTLGNFASEVAQFNGKQSYVITTGITGPPGQWRQYKGAIARVVPASDWTLVDLRALRPFARGKHIRDLPEDLRLLIFTTDAALYFGRAQPGHNSLKDRLEQNHKP